MSLFEKKKVGKRNLVLHIGSSSVLAAFFSIETRNTVEVPVIEATSWIEIPVQEELNFEQFLNGMTNVLDTVLAELVHQPLGAPDTITCFLGSPWYAVQSRFIRLEKNTPFTITEKVVSELIEKEIASFQKEELAKYADAGNDAQIIEKEIIHIGLNGYQTAHPYGQKAEVLEIGMIVSMSPETVIESIRDHIAKQYHTKEIIFHSFLYGGTLVARDLFLTTHHFLFVDIGGEITDIALMKNGMVMDVVSFPYGKNVLLRKCAKALQKNISDVETLLSLYRANTLESSMRLKIDTILETVRKEWTASFEVALSQLTTEFLLPEIIALTITKDMLDFFQTAIQSEAFSQFTLTEKPFVVIPITNQ